MIEVRVAESVRIGSAWMIKGRGRSLRAVRLFHIPIRHEASNDRGPNVTGFK